MWKYLVACDFLVHVSALFVRHRSLHTFFSQTHEIMKKTQYYLVFLFLVVCHHKRKHFRICFNQIIAQKYLINEIVNCYICCKKQWNWFWWSKKNLSAHTNSKMRRNYIFQTKITKQIKVTIKKGSFECLLFFFSLKAEKNVCCKNAHISNAH